MFNLFNHIHHNISINKNINSSCNSNYSFINSIFNDVKTNLNKNISSYYIDKIENNFAICENLKTKEYLDIDLQKLPKEIKQGDVIVLENGKYIIDNIETIKRKNQLASRLNNIWKK